MSRHDELHAIIGLDRRANPSSKREELDGIINFSILAMLGMGAGLHVGQNALIKTASSTRPGKRILASLFQSGVRHAKTGQQIHPGILRASDAIIGPEYSAIYREGIHSNRITRQAVQLGRSLPGIGKESLDAADVITGHRSKWTSKILNTFPKSNITTKRSAGWAGGLAGAGVAAAIDPSIAAINIGRTAIAETSIGKKVLKNRFMAGVGGHKPSAIRRNIEDLLVSPSLNKVQAVGYDATNGLRDILKKAGGVSGIPRPA